MALFCTPAEHAANPPSTWQVRKIAKGRWGLYDKDLQALDYFTTKREAELARTFDGRMLRLYELERRWFAGEQVSCWKPYVGVPA